MKPVMVIALAFTLTGCVPSGLAPLVAVSAGGAAFGPPRPRVWAGPYGSTCSTYGNNISCNNGLTAFVYGDETMWSNGVVCHRYGNEVSCN